MRLTALCLQKSSSSLARQGPRPSRPSSLARRRAASSSFVRHTQALAPREPSTASPPESELISREDRGLPEQELGMDPTLALLLGLPVPLLDRFWKADDMLPFVMLEQLQRDTS